MEQLEAAESYAEAQAVRLHVYAAHSKSKVTNV